MRAERDDVTSRPSRTIARLAELDRVALLGHGTGSPKNRSFCSRKITGLSSWIAAARRPFASYGFDGITTTRPGNVGEQRLQAL